MMLFVTSVVFAFICGFYLYIRNHNNYWRKRGVINTKTNFFFGYMLDVLKGTKSPEQIYKEVYESYPHEEAVGIYEILQPVLLVRDPRLIGHIMVKNFNHFTDKVDAVAADTRFAKSLLYLGGKRWKTVRAKLSPTFSSGKVKAMYRLMQECSQLLVDTRLRTCAEARDDVEMKNVVSGYSLDVLGSCIFGLNFNTIQNSKSKFRDIGRTLSSMTSQTLFRRVVKTVNPNLLKFLSRMPDSSNEFSNFFEDLLKQAEKSREAKSETRCDLLQIMIDIRNEESGMKDSLFTNDHIVSNMLLFYVTGYETVSITLTFCLYELALHPEIQEKLRQEINRVREANNGIFDLGTLSSMVYMDKVLSETLRKHAPAPFVKRVCTETYRVPNSSLVLEPGVRIIIPLSALHYDRKYFHHPEKFDPERFNEESIKKRIPYTYLPFGDGPRMCIGVWFAKLEMKCFLANVLPKYRFSSCQKTETEIRFFARNQHHLPKNGIWLTINKV